MHQADSLRARPDPQPPAFACSSTYGGLDAAWVHVAGALDIATAPALEQTLRESQSHARLVVLDLRELAFMDCAGVHIIVDASIRARQSGHRLVLVRARPSIYRVLTLTGSCADIEIADLNPVQQAASRIGPAFDAPLEPPRDRLTLGRPRGRGCSG